MPLFGVGLESAIPHERVVDCDPQLARRLQDAVRDFELPENWKSIKSASGGTYYWNRATDQTSWEHPLQECVAILTKAVRECQYAASDAEAMALAQGASRRSSVVQTLVEEARQRQVSIWTERWHDEAMRELGGWRSVASEDGSPPYFFRAGQEGAAAGGPPSSVTWEDPRNALELKLRFKSEFLSSFFPPSVGMESPQTRGPSRWSLAGDFAAPVQVKPRPRTKRATDGRMFRVEEMPTDHSCGFHGLGVNRHAAAKALLEHTRDVDVQNFLAADLAAAVQTNERASFPTEIGRDERLWAALDAYYHAQHSADEKRREALEVLAQDATPSAAAFARQAPEAAHDCLQKLCDRLRNEAVSAPPGSQERLRIMQRLGMYKTQLRDLEAASAKSYEAGQTLRGQCRGRAREYVEWVGSDSSFWLSFVRGVGGERGGGLLDALAKVFRLTVRVWAEDRASGRTAPDLELVHEVAYGGRQVDLWYQGERGHFDRLVPC